MSNRKLVKVEEAFSSELKERFESDLKKVDSALRNKTWLVAFTDFINQFIQNELVNYDKDLYQRVYHKNGRKYPSEKTISRAFITDLKASTDLLNICGWYMFKDSWSKEINRFDFASVVREENRSQYATQVKNLNAGTDIKVKIKNTTANIDDVKAGGAVDINIEQE